MNILTKGLVMLTLAMGVMGTASAEFIRTDWKSEGDAQVVTDKDTGIEWMKLNQTRNWSVDEVAAEMGEGGKFEGFRFATQAEVFELMDKWFPSSNITEDEPFYQKTTYRNTYTSSSVNTTGFFNWFGYRQSYYQSGTDWTRLSYGFTNDVESGEITMSGAYHRNYWQVNGTNRRVYSDWSTFESTTKSINYGVWIVSDGGETYSSLNDPTLNINNPNAPINASAPLAIGAIGLMLVGMRRRKTT